VKRTGEVFRRLVADESGQDLIEYALLTAIIGVASLLAYSTIPAKMGNAFQSWSSGVYDLWEPCDPGETYPCP
jgi:Flp pilus assembly pilin Flp